MKYLFFIVFFTFAYTTFSVAEQTSLVKSWTNCTKGNDAKIKSIVKALKVSGCNNVDVCPLKRGSNASIIVEFTPNIRVDKPKAGMYWTTRTRDFPFTSLKINGCQYVKCPVHANLPIIFHADLYLGRGLPAGQYPLKLKLYEKRMVVFCIMFTIKLS